MKVMVSDNKQDKVDKFYELYSEISIDIIDMDSMAESFRQSEETGAAISSEFSDMSKKKTTRVYQKRMQGVLQDMIKYGYI